MNQCSVNLKNIAAAAIALLAMSAAAEADGQEGRIKALEEKVAHLMQSASNAQSNIAEIYHTPEERRDIADLRLNGISVGALVEVEAAIGGEEDGEDFSDIVLATSEVGLDADLNEWTKASVLLLWEEDDTEPMDLDEATITLGNTESLPVYLTAGKMYVPFGRFASHFISDPLTLELAETRESALLLGYTRAPLEITGAVFNGDLDVDEDDDEAGDIVLSAVLNPAPGIEFGASWISHLGESDGLQDSLADASSDNEVDGANVFVCLESGAFMLDGEYIAALDNFDAGVAGDEEGAPRAWNFELAFRPTNVLELAAKVEGTDEWTGMPETQYGAALSYGLTDSISTSIEFLHGEFENSTHDRNVATLQIATEF
jgi:hypothetical protein